MAIPISSLANCYRYFKVGLIFWKIAKSYFYLDFSKLITLATTILTLAEMLFCLLVWHDLNLGENSNRSKHVVCYYFFRHKDLRHTIVVLEWRHQYPKWLDWAVSKACGIGVALAPKTEVGKFRADRPCRSGHKHVEKSCPIWDLNPQPQDLEADVLPVGPRWCLMPSSVWSVCGLCAKCDHAVYSQ